MDSERRDVKRVTWSGSNSVFNAVGDWVYEEEVLFEDRALWWSPDSRRIAFLSFDDSQIEDYALPSFIPPADYNGTRWHPVDINSLHYPLPGGKNPVVQAHVFATDSWEHVVSLSRTSDLSKDSVLFEVIWTTSEVLLVKEMSRDAARGQVFMFDLDRLLRSQLQVEGKVVRQLGLGRTTPGWIECVCRATCLPALVAPDWNALRIKRFLLCHPQWRDRRHTWTSWRTRTGTGTLLYSRRRNLQTRTLSHTGNGR